jgi:FAD/FMN-containing dehydrogenase/Fe-S oxidoreductase
MYSDKIINQVENLRSTIEGDIYSDLTMRLLYATDASAYREIPLAVIRPKNEEDIRKIIVFGAENNVPLIPRTAGTSLAGQVVGNGIVVDVSKYLTNIIEINEVEHWVRVQPGVVLDELNKILEPKGLFFGPETSTSNRCMVGGMVGNNSCGAHSLIYGSTRDHTLEIKAFLSDGSTAHFRPLTKQEFQDKMTLKSLEGNIYKSIFNILSLPENQKNIEAEFPEKSIHRRNTGYAIDVLLDSEIFTNSSEKFNFCKLLAGSEGTLAFTTEIKLNLVPLPPKETALVCVHLDTVEQSLKANLIALKYKPFSVELMDKTIIDLTNKNHEQQKNRFFIQGEPGAILIVEFSANTRAEILNKASEMEADMRKAGYGYHFPVISGSDIKKVWNLRKAGLGVLSNMPGDAKPVPVTEDTAVSPQNLPLYIAEFDAMLRKYNLTCVYHAHIATGELHLRPILNLKSKEHIELFRTVALETASLVKKYRGSLSGEHGDGRLRGEFIQLMVGESNYQLLIETKKAWDPNNIFNPGKITNTPQMNTHLRFEPDANTRQVDTVFDFSNDQGIQRATERCNGSADCRKTEIIGGTMCPSYMATRDEKATTRARANILREFLTNSAKKNPFDHKEIYEVMDLCLSCKACKSECPSNVDVAKLKAEFLQHYYDSNGIPLRTRAIAYIAHINAIGSLFPGITNFFLSNRCTSGLIKSFLGFAPDRSIPTLAATTLNKYYKSKGPDGNSEGKSRRKIYLFNDEFTNFNDSHIGIQAILLLENLGYEVTIPKHVLSGRTFLSKGMLRKAKSIAIKNVLLLKDIINENNPIIGIEPSAILGFRDEYPDLVGKNLKPEALKLAKNALLFEEFIAAEFEKGNISGDQFTKESKNVLLHGHCQQKAVASTLPTRKMLSIPINYNVSEIPSGCCGMAGSFGYEKEHFDISMKVGELVLFPTLRKSENDTIIVAPGTSCRHQIKDGVQKSALHPVEVLYQAIKKS